MEKYYVTQGDTHHDSAFSQYREIQNKTGLTKCVVLHHSTPKIPVGTTVKVYETADKEPFPLTMAYSYKINGKRFITIDLVPRTTYSIENFWSRLGFWDGVRLHRDIKQELRQRGILPAFSKNTNLRLLLGDKIIDTGR